MRPRVSPWRMCMIQMLTHWLHCAACELLKCLAVFKNVWENKWVEWPLKVRTEVACRRETHRRNTHAGGCCTAGPLALLLIELTRCNALWSWMMQCSRPREAETQRQQSACRFKSMFCSGVAWYLSCSSYFRRSCTLHYKLEDSSERADGTSSGSLQ